ncbi:MAG TPA: ankyrin repeat domain-containing protein [Verrucomicrobiae bacterium]|nr:ankyrin repeat domain-containing protein [Verrucomicrobiae bacterium]
MNPIDLLRQAFCENNASLLRETLRQNPQLLSKINDPLGPFDSPLINSAQTSEILDVLLDAGADINAKSHWWAGGFGLLDTVNPELAAYAIRRGARLEVHSAARLGLFDDLRSLVSGNPELVHARGGDGKTPLHCAASVPIAEFLLQQGAQINARDIDHESTPVQHLVGEHPNVARYLVEKGCEVDIFIPAALGLPDLAEKILDSNPNCVWMRINCCHFPMSNPKAGGTIYQWTLAFNASPHEVASSSAEAPPQIAESRKEVFALLMDRSPLELQLLISCWLGDDRVDWFLAKDRELAKKIPPAETRQIADAARNNRTTTVRLMVRAGLPLDARGQHGATALHWAAWHGNVETAKLLLSQGAPLEDSQNEFKGTPMDWAIHGSENSWHRQHGDHPAVVQVLLSAGAKVPKRSDGTPAVRKILEEFSSRS